MIIKSSRIHKENRIAVIALHKVGMKPNTIFKSIYMFDISEMMVYQAINRCNETSSVCDKKDQVVHVEFLRKRRSKAIKERKIEEIMPEQQILSREVKIRT